MKEDPIFDAFFLLKEAGKYDEAFKLLLSCRRKYAGNYVVHFLLGTVLWLADRHKESIPFFRKSIELHPKHELSSLGLFHSLVNLGKIHMALNEVRRYYLTNPARKKRHNLAIAEMVENIDNFSTSEQVLIRKVYGEFVKRRRKQI